MNKKKTEIIKKYIHLEKKIFKLMSGICSGFCSSCEITCCTPVVCKDISKSKWLYNIIRFTKGIKTKKELNKIINEHFHSGGESDKPCPFNTGRPVICGRYFCRTIISNLETEFLQFLLFQLADIIPTFLDQKINKKKIKNMDLYDESYELTNELQRMIIKNINLSLKKYNIIKNYIHTKDDIVDKNILFKDLMFLEKHSELSLSDTFS